MALTPEDVRNKLFTTVRLREGYEQAEVDEFLDEVEAELQRLLQENDDLRTKLADAGSSDVADRAERPAKAATTPAATPEPAQAREPAKAQPIVVRTSDDVGAAAAKVLNMAQRTADQVVGEAQEEADRLLDEAKSSADRLTTDARVKADQVDRETRDRTSALEQQLEQQRQTTLGRLQDEKGRLEREVESLRSFEREYRGRLRTFLEGQLQQLSSRGSDDTPLAPSGGSGGATSATAADASVDSATSGRGTHALNDSGDADGADGTADRDGTDGTAAGVGSGPDGSGSSAGDEPATKSGAGSRSALGRILDEEERGSDQR